MRKRLSLGRVDELVVGEDAVPAAHGEPDTVLVVLEGIFRHVGSERLQHRHPGVAVVVDVVVCGTEKKWDVIE